MVKDLLPTLGASAFEGLKRTNAHDAEYWSARALQPLLGYNQWRRFEDAINRTMASCEASGNKVNYHFAGTSNMIEIGKGGQREVPDFHLSRFACYLIAQNGDPRKPEIANAQKYFAVQGRRQELSDQLMADKERLELRKRDGQDKRPVWAARARESVNRAGGGQAPPLRAGTNMARTTLFQNIGPQILPGTAAYTLGKGANQKVDSENRGQGARDYNKRLGKV